MKTLHFDGDLRFVRDAAIPRREDEALIEVICAGICNTDLEILKGYAAFRGTPGHEFVGRVAESPDASLIGRRVAGEINVGCGKCERCRAGDARHCPTRTVLGIHNRDGAFAEFLSLPARNLIPVPDSIDDLSAVFIEPLAAACHILDQVDIDSSSHVAVIGDGKLAQLILLAIARAGCHLTVIGKHKEKLELARKSGARAMLIKQTPEEKYDVVVEASGSREGLPLALKLVRPQGAIVLKSTHHHTTEVDMSQAVVNEVSIIGSRCGRFLPAIELLSSGAIDVRPLISDSFPLEEGLEAFDKAAEPSSMKIIFRMV
ncbi:MAG TPA: alcohol dehydrogenase catalytic domain-containing protein [Blastocatellia bacterium]